MERSARPARRHPSPEPRLFDPTDCLPSKPLSSVIEHVSEVSLTVPYYGMSLTSLYGHKSLQERLSRSLKTGTLPASLLFHGPRGIGKQRLALWLAQLLLCERDN